MTLAAPPSGELVRGWTDLPLSPEGESLAKKLATSLKGSNIAFMTCSSLERAEETAKAIEQIAKIPLVESTDAIRTWDLGELEGSLLKDAEKIIHYYVTKAPHDKPKGGESFNHFRGRVLPYFQNHMKIGVEHKVPIAEVTHHWVCELVEHWIKSGAKPDLSLDTKMLFRGSQDPPGTILDMRPEELTPKNSRWGIKKSPAGTKQFGIGPVLIRHATTAWNKGGKG